MLTFSASSDGAPADAWSLYARPGRWHEWAPHLRGAWRLGDPEVEAGRRGAVWLVGLVPIPATIVHKRAGRAWTWQVGPVTMVHRVQPRSGGGCDVVLHLRAPGPLEVVLGRTYGPVIALLLRNLARAAAR